MYWFFLIRNNRMIILFWTSIPGDLESPWKQPSCLGGYGFWIVRASSTLSLLRHLQDPSPPSIPRHPRPHVHPSVLWSGRHHLLYSSNIQGKEWAIIGGFFAVWSHGNGCAGRLQYRRSKGLRSRHWSHLLPLGTAQVFLWSQCQWWWFNSDNGNFSQMMGW